jgi:flagellar hook-length control protein FliK
MHTAFKLFDIPGLSGTGAGDKVTGRLSRLGESDLDSADTDFLKVMGALMQVAPDQLESSLERIGLGSLGGGDGSCSPLMDLEGCQEILKEVLDFLNSDGSEAFGEVTSKMDELLQEIGPPADISATDDAAVDRTGLWAAAGVRNSDASKPLLDAQATLSDIGESTDTNADDEASQATSVPKAGKPVGGSEFEPLVVRQGLVDGVQRQVASKADPSGKTASETAKAEMETLAQADAKPTVRDDQTRESPPELRQDAGLIAGEGPASERRKTRSSAEAGKPVVEKVMGEPRRAAAAGQTEAGSSQKASLLKSEAAGTDETIQSSADKTVQSSTIDEGDGTAGGRHAESDQSGLRAAGVKETVQRTMTSGEGARNQTVETSASRETQATKELQNDVMRQIVQRMTMRSNGVQSQMNVRLKPEFLGNVHLQVATDNHQVAVRITAESPAVKEMIEQHIQHLRTDLQQHGLEIDKFEVFVGNQGENWKSGQESAGFRQAMQQGSSEGRQQQAADQDGKKQQEASHGRQNPYRDDSGEIDYFA